jgi:hypothetical protein
MQAYVLVIILHSMFPNTTENIHVDNSRPTSSSMSVKLDDLSGCDAQFLTINNILATTNEIPLTKRTRL